MTVMTRADQDSLVPVEAAICRTLWETIRREAEAALACEPALAPLFVKTILGHGSLEDAVVSSIANRLGSEALPAFLIEDLFREAVAEDPAIRRAFCADISAVRERDPACERLVEPLLYYKGFHAIATHRLAHWLWRHGRPDVALCLQSRSSEVFQTDINPAARFGKGIFLDHATGLVVGATAVVDDDVSILQDVTLGGTGKEVGDRHPKVRRGVLIGPGAKILGNIEIGAGSLVAAGSIVLRPVPPGTTVAGVPARIIGLAGPAEPSQSMEQILRQSAYESFAYSI
jgi:serine O-acetyltransferase